jgi:rhamnogalacturonyl hydrolase YesR
MNVPSIPRHSAAVWGALLLGVASPATGQDADFFPAPSRPTRQVAEELAAVYGQRLTQVAYIPALPLVAKLRLSDLTGIGRYREQVESLAAPFLAGERDHQPANGSEQAGALLFAELAARSEAAARPRWIALCRAAADQALDERGQPAVPVRFHNDMSDALFMATPILAATGKLTGERRYFDAAQGHVAAMRQRCWRPDGLYRHWPGCEAAWGRGNGFPALGLAWALSCWPEDHPGRRELLSALTEHLEALRPHQDAESGCWRQVIDHPESYPEYSCTAMIGTAMLWAVERGWVPRQTYQPHVQRAWQAIVQRTSPDGRLVKVCISTGKLPTVEAYVQRPSTTGRDDRGGAMGLLFAVERLAAGLQ